jgi:hypothetical protein
LKIAKSFQIHTLQTSNISKHWNLLLDNKNPLKILVKFKFFKKEQLKIVLKQKIISNLAHLKTSIIPPLITQIMILRSSTKQNLQIMSFYLHNKTK